MEADVKTALENYGYIGPEALHMLDEIRAWLRTLPPAPRSVQEDGLWSCHGIARAAHERWKLGRKGWHVRDGHFQGNYQHTWLEKALSVREGLILDVYPVASAGSPLLIEAKSPASPWRTLYKAAPEFYAERSTQFALETKFLLAA